jgi:hypothetical protein
MEINKKDKKTISKKYKPKTAVYVWLGAIIFGFLFTTLIWLLGPNLNHFTAILVPDQGSSWYFWKLPSRDFWTMSIVWIFYLANQFLIWGAIYWAQKNLTKEKANPTYNLTKYNIVVLSITVFFVFLHLVQTHLWFDGLAQDVPIFTSQGSVILMLAIALVLLNPVQGLFLGKKAGKPFTERVTEFFRHTHMYIISWALIYTFWFHPMATDPQLLTGFFFMFLLFTQMSLAYTKVHLDLRWIVILESWVAIHAVFVAVYNTLFFNSPDMWPMFFSGFAFMFVFTYMYALNVKKYIRWLVTAAYLLFVLFIYIPAPYGFGRDPSFLLRLEFLWIPIVLYGLAALFALVVFLWFKRNKDPYNVISDKIETSKNFKQ